MDENKEIIEEEKITVDENSVEIEGNPELFDRKLKEPFAKGKTARVISTVLSVITALSFSLNEIFIFAVILSYNVNKSGDSAWAIAFLLVMFMIPIVILGIVQFLSTVINLFFTVPMIRKCDGKRKKYASRTTVLSIVGIAVSIVTFLIMVSFLGSL